MKQTNKQTQQPKEKNIKYWLFDMSQPPLLFPNPEIKTDVSDV